MDLDRFKDIDVVHSGIEVEASYNPNSNLRLKGMVSIGDWRYTKDFEAALFDDNNQQIGTGTLYLKDYQKLVMAVQFVSYLESDYRIGNKLNVDLGYRFVDNL